MWREEKNDDRDRSISATLLRLARTVGRGGKEGGG
jgi:hypothetical protein